MPAPRGIVQWLDQDLHKSRLLPRGAKLLVAVSGGADSVALLRLLLQINRSDYWDWTLVVGHVDHGMRGKASSDDAAWVKSLAGEWKLRFVKKTLKLPAATSEGVARQWRLNALAALVRAEECVAAVMGHHLDDQAETVLMRIFRGCGVEGLEGMRPLSETFGGWKRSQETLGGGGGVGAGLRIYRPLLSLRRERLREYLRVIGQEWREDATNQSPKFTRNQVRGTVLPVVEKIWPGRGGGDRAAGARIAGEVQGVMREHEEPIWQGAQFREDGAIELPRTWLRMAYPAVVMQVLRDAIELAGGTREIADFERIAEAVRLIRGKTGGKTIQMGRGVVVEMEGQVVRIVNHGAPPAQRRVGGGGVAGGGDD